MVTPTATQQPAASLADALQKWIERTGGELNPCANVLGVSWNTLRDWSTGRTIPRTRDLVALIDPLNLPLADLLEMRQADVAARLERAKQAMAKAEAGQPVPGVAP